MFDTMVEYHGVGLAGPQVHLPLRIFVFDSRQETEPRRGVVFNATYEPLDESRVIEWEGCLSVPFLSGQVPRYDKIRVRGVDGNGKALELTASGYLARIFQHEIDHTDGHVYLDRMPDLKSLSYTVVL